MDIGTIDTSDVRKSSSHTRNMVVVDTFFDEIWRLAFKGLVCFEIATSLFVGPCDDDGKIIDERYLVG